MWVMTFHSLCVRILRREAARLGMTQHFTIYDAADSQRLMQAGLPRLDLDTKRIPPRSFSAQIVEPKNELVDPETFAWAGRQRSGARSSPRCTSCYQERLTGRARSTSTT